MQLLNPLFKYISKFKVDLQTRQHCPKKGYGSQTKTANENETYLTIGGGGNTETGGGTV